MMMTTKEIFVVFFCWGSINAEEAAYSFFVEPPMAKKGGSGRPYQQKQERQTSHCLKHAKRVRHTHTHPKG